MADECSKCRPASDSEKAEARQKFFAAVNRIESGFADALKTEMKRATFADSVAGLEEMPMFVVSFPHGSSLGGFHFAFTVEYLVQAPEEEIAAGLAEDMTRQLEERKADLPWWKRMFSR